MATLALSLAGQVVGGMVGGPIGATIGRALGALAGAAVDNALFAEDRQPSRAGADIRLQGSSEGGAVPRLYGWARVTGNVIWATELEEIAAETRGAKAMPGAESEGERTIVASFALALCEGPVTHIGRIWADGQLLDTSGLTLRVYKGGTGQMPDSLIEARQGAAPAYRDTCYLVFERLPLAPFGNRIPNLSVEVCRSVGELEPAIRAVTVIPGATEYGYDPTPRVRVLGLGVTANENTHAAKQVSDWAVSIDELQALCPNLTRVALVVAWFGDTLDAGACRIMPKIEDATRQIEGGAWGVAGLNRATAPVVSLHAGSPAYGGTPSDDVVLAAIADLKARGLAVMLYPMLLMDVPTGNGLANPYGGTGQPAYPWRGRVTVSPAPGRAGTPDGSGAAATAANAFMAGTWGYRSFVLHYAGLAVAAGGVDAFVIGSEMRGLTTVRGTANSFPFVGALATLAADVRAVVGAGTKLTYAADWSEFSGYQPPGGGKFFHLDPLWASAAIDAVGIDNYMPIADWRDGDGHADAALAATTYDLDYLEAGIAGGEGHDWYYASDSDRVAGLRSPISDGSYGEPWVWRFKHIRAFWENAHYDRPGGVRAASPTAWSPRSKPIWFTELGCAAVDKGANQPNIFGDTKSGEDGRPYFSTGTPDGLMQRQFLRAHLAHWARPANNPATGLYGGPMLDLTRLYLWTWDARPYPAFPVERAVWADGPNHAGGHWLTGRLGAAASDELAKALATDYGVALAGAEARGPLVQGLAVEAVTSLREAMTDVAAACGLDWRDGADGLRLAGARVQGGLVIQADGVVDGEGALISRRRPDPTETVGRVALGFADRELGYRTATATASRPGRGATSGKASGLTLDAAGARAAAEALLVAAGSGGEMLELTLPPSRIALEAGDVIALAGADRTRFRVTEIRDGLARRISARALPPPVPVGVTVDRPTPLTLAPPPRARPEIALLHLPAGPEVEGTQLAVAAYASPWPGVLSLVEAGSAAPLLGIRRAACLGTVLQPFAPGPITGWDRANRLDLTLVAGHVSEADPFAVLAGSNRLAVETDAGEWEVLGFAHAELIAPQSYRLTQLLRGLNGTDPAMGPVGVGRRVVLLDDRLARMPVPRARLGGTMALTSYAGADDLSGTSHAVALGLGPALPLPPVHLRARRSGADIVLSWLPRLRADPDNWALADAPSGAETYELRVVSGVTELRRMTVTGAGATYTAAQQAADFGGATPDFSFSVALVSPVYGPGHRALGDYHA